MTMENIVNRLARADIAIIIYVAMLRGPGNERIRAVNRGVRAIKRAIQADSTTLTGSERNDLPLPMAKIVVEASKARSMQSSIDTPLAVEPGFDALARRPTDSKDIMAATRATTGNTSMEPLNCNNKWIAKNTGMIKQTADAPVKKIVIFLICLLKI